MKTKFLAGLVATIISLVIIVVLSILIVLVFNLGQSDFLIKIIAIATIGIWMLIYGWLKPKPIIEQKIENDTQDVAVEQENKTERNSYK